MRHWTTRIFPSMFHRRVALLGVTVVTVCVLLSIQLARLTIVQGSQWRDRAESTLVVNRLVPTSRGAIYDSELRPLAVELPSEELAVRYSVITGQWAYQRARRAARKAHGREWDELPFEERERHIAQEQKAFDEQTERLWSALCAYGDMGRDELNARKRTIVKRVQRIASSVWRRDLEARRKAGHDVEWSDVSQPVGEQRAHHPLLEDLPTVTADEVRHRIAQAGDDADNVWSQVELTPSRTRAYPLTEMTLLIDTSTFPTPLRQSHPVEVTVEGVGVHLLGRMRDAWSKDMTARPFRKRNDAGQYDIDPAGYLPGDRVGAAGVEQAMENVLRGTRGRVVQHLDTGKEVRDEPTPGGNVTLSIDMQLQARVQAVMTPALGLMKVQPWHARQPSAPVGTPLNGAAVIIDVDSAEVLAAVTVPTFTFDDLQNDPDSVWQDELTQRWVNRAIGRPYAPGSTMKPIVYVAAVTEGKHSAHHAINCKGHLLKHRKDRYRCWLYKQYGAAHGPLVANEAIQRSCNEFFYTLGHRMGAERLVPWYQRFGLGVDTGVELSEAASGKLPDVTGPGRRPEHEGILMGIGQGPISITPLQLASAYATLARGGTYLRPTFFRSIDDTRQRTDLGLSPAAVRLALDGLKRSVNDRHGTSHHIAMLNRETIFNIEGVTVMGKTGTATAAPHWIDRDGNGRMGESEIVRQGDHAWFVGLVQREGESRPAFAFAVIVEFGGSGGACAGPIANQLLHALRAEGYL